MEIANYSNLFIFTGNFNNLNGSTPTVLGGLNNNLQNVNLASNTLSGEILFQLSELRLMYLNLHGNQL